MDFPPLTGGILGPHGNGLGSLEGRKQPGKGQASLFHRHPVLLAGDFGIGQDGSLLRVFSNREVEDCESEIDTDLGGGETEAGGGP